MDPLPRFPRSCLLDLAAAPNASVVECRIFCITHRVLRATKSVITRGACKIACGTADVPDLTPIAVLQESVVTDLPIDDQITDVSVTHYTIDHDAGMEIDGFLLPQSGRIVLRRV